MAEGYTFISAAVGREAESIVTAVVAVGVLTFSGIMAATSLRRASNALVPDEKLSLRNTFDLLTGFLVDLSDRTMGKENRKYFPFVATIFVYILFMNFMGLIPGFLQPTGSFTINLGISLVVFTAYNYWGVRETGFINYLKHFCGPFPLFSIWGIFAVFLFVLEMFSNFIRPLTLSIRLFANMTADHAILAAFTDLTKFIIPVVFYVLGSVISVIQAFVFCLLTMVYIKLAVAHHGDDHHGDDHAEEHHH